MKEETAPGSIISKYEIAEILGITRQGTDGPIDHPDFPAPICKQGKWKSPLFDRREVEAFAAERKTASSAEPAAA